MKEKKWAKRHHKISFETVLGKVQDKIKCLHTH